MRGATIRDKREYLRADLVHRQNAADFEKFLHKLKDAAFAHPSSTTVSAGPGSTSRRTSRSRSSYLRLGFLNQWCGCSSSKYVSS